MRLPSLSTARTWQALAQPITLATSAVLAILFPSLHSEYQNHWRSPIGHRAIASLIFISMIVLVRLSGNLGEIQVPRSAPAQSLCTRTEPRVCIRPDNAVWLPELEKMTERARSLERFNLSIPGIFAERGVHEATEDNAFGLKGGTTWFTASDWSWSITSPFLVNYPAPSENSGRPPSPKQALRKEGRTPRPTRQAC